VAAVDGVEIVVCPSFLALQPLVDSARGSQVAIYAQTMHEADEGPYTGEVSASMLSEIEVAGVVLGHSERREYFDETDRALQLKVPKALEAGLTPILCVGETEDERERGETERKLRNQVQEGLEQVPAGRLPEVVVAYEPIWAIGTGKVATPEQAQEAAGFVRALLAGLDATAADQVRILYGGSCKPDNAAELMALPDVDGALVGGASLDPGDFGAIVEIAARTA
jgi:triosephosphate isomerase